MSHCFGQQLFYFIFTCLVVLYPPHMYKFNHWFANFIPYNANIYTNATKLNRRMNNAHLHYQKIYPTPSTKIQCCSKVEYILCISHDDIVFVYSRHYTWRLQLTLPYHRLCLSRQPCVFLMCTFQLLIISKTLATHQLILKFNLHVYTQMLAYE